ncbi:MAG: hydroxyethylthiazole kinase [Selenomonadaceae bacterium]
MLKKDEIRRAVRQAIDDVRRTNPMAPSITNTVTINLVANVQLAIGGSAAMVYMPDEGEAISAAGGATYINMGTILSIYTETLARTARALHKMKKPWVLDPVGIGLGSIRMNALKDFKDFPPSIVRGNASEIIALANLWGLETNVDDAGVRGVDSTDTVESARRAAVSLARFIGGAVAVSGATDLVTDGAAVVTVSGGSKFMPMITGAGCSLGGAMAIYACCATPFIAALTSTMMFDFAGRAAEDSDATHGPGSFQVNFLDELYRAGAAEVADMNISVEEAER